MKRRERRPAANKSDVVPNDPGPATPAALYAAGLRHLQAGRHLDAQVCCQQALAIDASHADTLHLMGLVCLGAGQFDHAVEWIVRAIRHNPKTEFLSTLGTALQHQGRHEEALKAFDKAVQLKPEDAELWKNLGSVLIELQRPADAVLSFQQALKLDPHNWDAANKCGTLLHRLGRLEEAVAHFKLYDQLQPNLALAMRTQCLFDMKRFEEALADNRRAQALDPSNADTCNNIGIALQLLGREEEALQWFDRALELRPNSAVVANNKAAALVKIQKFDDAFAAYGQAKALDPGNALIDWDLALLHLLTGNFAAGWAGREARRRLPSHYPKFSQPMWLGEDGIEGKTILVHMDEGLGDSIQFARYIPMLAARGARIVVVDMDALSPLLSGLPGVSQFVPFSAGTLPPFDLHCPMTNLALAFGTRLQSIPSTTSYLPAPAPTRVQAWEGRLGPHERLRVGLVWSGNPNHKNDHNRSIPLRALARSLDADASFVSLQKDPRPDDRATLLERTDILDVSAQLIDFSETAALVSCLDLVITVDTSVAHLAAALGRPTWILLPYTPDWRWLLGRDDSPWYPTVRLFRQTETRDYASVLDRVRTELLARVAAFKAEQT